MVLQRSPQSATIFGFDSTTEAEVKEIVELQNDHDSHLQAFVSCTFNGETLGLQRATVVASSTDQVMFWF